MSVQSEQVQALEAIQRTAKKLLNDSMELNGLIARSQATGFLQVDVVRPWNVQVAAENTLKNLELKAKGVSRLVRVAS